MQGETANDSIATGLSEEARFNQRATSAMREAMISARRGVEIPVPSPQHVRPPNQRTGSVG